MASRTADGGAVLNASGASGVVYQINASRAFMRGVNNQALPVGAVTVRPNGNVNIRTAAGADYVVRNSGRLASIAVRGNTVDFRPDGRVSGIRTPAIDVHRGVHGERIVVSRRPDHSILVSAGPRQGYLERTVMFGKRPVIERTYVSSGHAHTLAFLAYSYRGLMFRRYIHRYYYAPAFYFWLFDPWARPVGYSWGWAGDPWFLYYSGYFQPYAMYPGATAWLTDYFLADTLAGAYDMQDQAQPLPGYDDGLADPPPDDEIYGPADSPITPEVKAALADEVASELSDESAVASASAGPEAEELPAALKPGRLFVVSSVLDVMTPGRQSCELTPGDVLRLEATPAADGEPALLTVMAAKRRDCPRGAAVNVSLEDLAEMQNNLRAQLDAGLEELRAGAGARGLPSAPASATPRPAMPDVQLTPDPGVAALIDAQRQGAAAVEASTLQAVPIAH